MMKADWDLARAYDEEFQAIEAAREHYADAVKHVLDRLSIRLQEKLSGRTFDPGFDPGDEFGRLSFYLSTGTEVARVGVSGWFATPWGFRRQTGCLRIGAYWVSKSESQTGLLQSLWQLASIPPGDEANRLDGDLDEVGTFYLTARTFPNAWSDVESTIEQAASLAAEWFTSILIPGLERVTELSRLRKLLECALPEIRAVASEDGFSEPCIYTWEEEGERYDGWEILELIHPGTDGDIWVTTDPVEHRLLVYVKPEEDLSRLESVLRLVHVEVEGEPAACVLSLSESRLPDARDKIVNVFREWMRLRKGATPLAPQSASPG